MIERDDRMFSDWLREGPERGPIDGPERVFAQTRTMRQRPAWTFVSRWLGSAWPEQRVLAPALLVVLLLMLALAAALFVGSTRPRVAPLTGPAGNGAFAWDTGQGGQVFLAGPDGKGAHAIEGAWAITRSPSFSRDGTKVVFWSRPNQDQGTPLDVFSASADGSNVRKINGDQRLDINVQTYASWSPDGQHVVISSMEDGASSLYVLTVDGSEPPLAITGTDASRGGEVWSPDGQWIAFHELKPGPGGEGTFAVIRPDGKGERTFHHQPDPPDGGFDNGPVWAPDSSAIAYSRMGSLSDPRESPRTAYVAVQPLDGEERILYADAGGSIGWPEWSPNGKWIGFGVGSDIGRAMIIHPDRSGLVKLSAGPGQGAPECGIRWAPDGQSLVSNCAGFTRYYLSDLTHPVPLPLPSNAAGFDWQRAPLP